MRLLFMGSSLLELRPKTLVAYQRPDDGSGR
jgi:hypothetical protein